MQTNEQDVHPADHPAEPRSSKSQGRQSQDKDGSTQTSPGADKSLRGGTRRHRLCGPITADALGRQAPPVRPTPLPKRPKGRLFVGCLLLLICAALAHYVWDWRFRYEARGIVQGRVLEVSPPWDGNVTALHVRGGDNVRQGQLLVSLENVQYQQRLAEVNDELKLAQAKLEAQVSQLRWQSQLRGDRNQKALSEYYELWGELLDQRSQLEQARTDLERLEAAQQKNSLAVSQKDLVHARFRVSGRREKVRKLAEAVEQLKKRVEIYEQFQDDATAQIRPEILYIENLQAELKRHRELVLQGQLRSPVNGTVVKVRRFAGDFAKLGETVIEIVEDNSLEPVLYVSQDRADKWRVDDEVTIQVEPGGQGVLCRVTRLGEQMEGAPANIERYYQKGEWLLPVYLKPEGTNAKGLRMYLGSEISLTQRWIRSFVE